MHPHTTASSETYHALKSQVMASVSFGLISAAFLQINFAVEIPLCHWTADAFFPFLKEGGISQCLQLMLFSFAKDAIQ